MIKLLCLLAVCLPGLVALEREAYDARLLDEALGYEALVTLPAGYDADPDRRFGLLFLLHGAGGNEATWSQLVDLRQIADDYQRIVVCPSFGDYSWYVDRSVAGELVNRAETAFTDGLLPKLDERYRVPEAGHWITGFSMGGYGALRLGLRRPDLFRGIGALSPCIFPSQWEDRWHLGTAMGPVDERRRYDLQFRPELARLAEHAFSILCGDADFFYEENRYAHEALQKLGVEHQWLDVTGGHDARFWSAYLPVQLDHLAEQLASEPAAP